MPQLHTYNLFISHSWTYGDAYDRLTDFFDEHPYFHWTDYSVPKDDPIHSCGTDKKLEAAIRNKMQHASCVVVLAGVYATYSKWINKEVEIAKDLDKPIIAVLHWGAERASRLVTENADEIVRWNGDSIVDAIRNWAI